MGEVTLLAGGNPQVPKGDGPGPVRTYLGAMPGWKREVGRRLDHLIEEAIPGVRKAVKWNQPHYGTDGETWLLSFRCYTGYVQVQFLRGTDLEPVPPKPSKHEGVRYLDIREEDELDAAQLVSWFEQSGKLAGVRM